MQNMMESTIMMLFFYCMTLYNYIWSQYTWVLCLVGKGIKGKYSVHYSYIVLSSK